MASSLGRWLGQIARAPWWWALVVGLALRALWIVIIPNYPTSDQTIYHLSAISIAEGRGYVDQSGNPAGYWPVGYSAYLAPFYVVFGNHATSAYIANWLLSGLTIWFGVKLSVHWFGPVAARLTGWLLALHPTLVTYVTCVASENAFFTCTLLFALVTTRCAGEAGARAYGWAALAGLIAGLTGYVRATIALLGLLAPVLMWRRVPMRALVARTAVIAACAGVTLAPWAFRNLNEFGQFQPFSFNGSANLWMGNHEGSDGGYAALPPDTDSLSLPERERVLGKRAREFIFSHPLEYAKLSVLRIYSTMRTDTVSIGWNEPGLETRFGTAVFSPLKAMTTLVHFGLYGFLAFHLGRTTWRSLKTRSVQFSRGELYTLAALALLAFPFVFIVAGNRYHLPLIPFALQLAGHYIAQLTPPPEEA